MAPLFDAKKDGIYKPIIKVINWNMIESDKFDSVNTLIFMHIFGENAKIALFFKNMTISCNPFWQKGLKVYLQYIE